MWCVLLAAGTGFFAKRWWHFASRPSVQVIVDPDKGFSLYNGSEIATLDIHEDLSPCCTGNISRTAKADAMVDNKTWCDCDTNATETQSSISNFSCTELSAQMGTVSLKNKESIRSKIAKKGWETFDKRFKGWRKFPQKISNKGTSGTGTSQQLSGLLFDQGKAEISAGSLNQGEDTYVSVLEPSDELCPFCNLRGRSSSFHGASAPKRQRLESLDGGTYCQEEPLVDHSALKASACCVSLSSLTGYNDAAVPGDIHKRSDSQSIKTHSRPPQLDPPTFTSPAIEQINRDSVTGGSVDEQLSERQKELAYENWTLPDALMESRQARPSLTSTDSFKEEKLKSLQGMLETKSVGLLQSQIASQKHPQINRTLGSSMWEKESDCHIEAQSLRTMDSAPSPPSCFRPKECDPFAPEQRNSPFQLRISSHGTKLKVNHKTLDATNVGDAEAFHNDAQVNVTTEGSELGGTAKRSESKNMQTFSPLPLDVYVLSTLKPTHAEQPQQNDGSATNGNNINQLRTLSCSSERTQSLKSTELLQRACLPIFLNRRTVAGCVQSISALEASPKFKSSELTISSNEVLSFTFGLGIGLILTWSSCHEYKSEQLRSYEDPEFASATMEMPTLSPGFGVKFDQTAARHLNSLVDLHENVEVIEEDESAKSTLTEESLLKEECMSDLEAQLEAEFNLMKINLASGGCLADQSIQSEFVDPDQSGFPMLPQRDPKKRHLPRMLSLEQNKYDPGEVRGDCTNLPVSPRELEYRLRLILEERQQAEILQLEEQLQDVKQTLQLKEAELHEWKDRVRHLVNLSFTSTGSDAINTTWSSDLKERPYERDALDVYSEIESENDLTAPKPEHEKLIFPVKENSSSTCHFGSSFGWLEGCHNTFIPQIVAETHQDAHSRRMNCNHLLENVVKHNNDLPISESPMHYDEKIQKFTPWMQNPPSSQLKRKPNALYDFEADLSQLNGFESDSNSSCVSNNSIAFCTYKNALTMPLCQPVSNIPIEKPVAILPSENLEILGSKPVRSTTTGHTLGRGRRHAARTT